MPSAGGPQHRLTWTRCHSSVDRLDAQCDSQLRKQFHFFSLDCPFVVGSRGRLFHAMMQQISSVSNKLEFNLCDGVL
jgi:hypothetical protein